MGGQLAPKGAQIRIAGALSLFVLASLYIYTHPAWCCLFIHFKRSGAERSYKRGRRLIRVFWSMAASL